MATRRGVTLVAFLAVGALAAGVAVASEFGDDDPTVTYVEHNPNGSATAFEVDTRAGSPCLYRMDRRPNVLRRSPDGELVAILVPEGLTPADCDPPASTTTSSTAPTTSTTSESTTTTSTTTTTAPPTTTTSSTTTTTAPPSGYPDIPSEFDPAPYLVAPWAGNTDYSWFPGAAFRMFCSFSHLGFDDPIIAPGQQFGHLHMFFGNRLTDRDSTWASLRSTGDGSCDGGPLNRTAYWFPAVFDTQHRVVAPDYFELYYKGEEAGAGSGTLAQKQARIQAIEPYPNGLRMLSWESWWACISNSSGAVLAQGATIPNCGAGNWLRAEVRFPYCWDGVNLDSPDHMSHVTFPASMWGPCPSGTVHLPELTEFAWFQVQSSSGNASGWYLSSDRMDPTSPLPNGSTLHADWFGAWDHDVLDRWVTACIHGMRSTSNGNLCDGEQLIADAGYSGPRLISGWTPTPSGD